MGQEQLNHNEILERLKAIEKNQIDMAKILTPMNDSYQAAIRIGKWLSGILIFLSVLVGIILSIKDLVTKK